MLVGRWVFLSDNLHCDSIPGDKLQEVHHIDLSLMGEMCSTHGFFLFPRHFSLLFQWLSSFLHFILIERRSLSHLSSTDVRPLRHNNGVDNHLHCLNALGNCKLNCLTLTTWDHSVLVDFTTVRVLALYQWRICSTCNEWFCFTCAYKLLIRKWLSRCHNVIIRFSNL